MLLNFPVGQRSHGRKWDPVLRETLIRVCVLGVCVGEGEGGTGIRRWPGTDLTLELNLGPVRPGNLGPSYRPAIPHQEHHQSVEQTAWTFPD